MKLKLALFAFALVVLPVHAAAPPYSSSSSSSPAPSLVFGNVSSTSEVVIGGVPMSPRLAPSWPVAPGDQITVTSSPARLVVWDKNVAILDPDSVARLRITDNGKPYIYIGKGGLSFETRKPELDICIGNRLFIPTASASGRLWYVASGAVAKRMARGAFTEEARRTCDQNGPLLMLTVAPQAAAVGVAGGAGAAGGIAGAGATAASSAAGAGAAGAAGAGAASAAGAVGAAGAAGAASAAGVAVSGVAVATASAAGVAAAAGVVANNTTTATSSCTSPSGCNFNPPAGSTTTP